MEAGTGGGRNIWSGSRARARVAVRGRGAEAAEKGASDEVAAAVAALRA